MKIFTICSIHIVDLPINNSPQFSKFLKTIKPVHSQKNAFLRFLPCCLLANILLSPISPRNINKAITSLK